MQDKYAGDIGDFSKFGLLRALAAASGLRLGLVWQLTPDEPQKSDGRHIDYLNLDGKHEKSQRRFEPGDPELYAKLREVVRCGGRSVRALEATGVLPTDACCFRDELRFAAAEPDRAKERRAWFAAARRATADAKLVCFDPDNGLQVESVEPTSANGPKYLFFEELTPFLERGQSLVIYQHLTRRGTAEEQAQRRFAQLRAVAPRDYDLFALRWRPVSGRFYFVAAAPRHRLALGDGAASLLSAKWQGHFQLLTPADRASTPPVF